MEWVLKQVAFIVVCAIAAVFMDYLSYRKNKKNGKK